MSLGVLLRPMPSLAQGILILLCFVAFYLRRYGPRFAIAPVFAAITYLLVIMLPPIGPIALPQMVTAVLLVTAVAIGLHFVAWGPSEIRTFHQRLWSLVSRYQELTLALKQCCDQAQLDADQCLAFKPLINETEAHFRNLYAHLGRYACNQEHQEALHDWLQCQYATFKTLQMAWESILQLARQGAPGFGGGAAALVRCVEQFILATARHLTGSSPRQHPTAGSNASLYPSDFQPPGTHHRVFCLLVQYCLCLPACDRETT